MRKTNEDGHAVRILHFENNAPLCENKQNKTDRCFSLNAHIFVLSLM